MEGKKPRLRPLTVFPHEESGQRLICFRDPEQYTDAVAALPPPLAIFLLEVLDGEHDFPAIQEEYRRRSGGEVLEAEQFEGILDQLDEALFLVSPRFRAAEEAVREKWRALSARPAVLAGQAYPDDPDELRAFLDGFSDGVPAPTPEASGAVQAVAVPHLDPASGGAVVARGLAGFAESFPGGP